MDIRVDSKEVKKARSKLVGRQITFKTPLSNLERFLESIERSEFLPDTGVAYIEQYIFEPKNTNSLLQNAHSDAVLASNTIIKTTSSFETKNLLLALLSDWLDFTFLLQDSRFGIYADHDEYCTFFSKHPMVISDFKANFVNDGFKLVPGYARSFT